MSTRQDVNRMLATTATAATFSVDPEPWMADSLCVEVDSDIFFVEKGESTHDAKLVCRRCEVADECLKYAMDRDERFGVWGGYSERERRRIKRGLSVPQKQCRWCRDVIPTGTASYCGQDCKNKAEWDRRKRRQQRGAA